jgi:amidase
VDPVADHRHQEQEADCIGDETRSWPGCAVSKSRACRRLVVEEHGGVEGPAASAAILGCVSALMALPASELARRIADRQISSGEVVAAHLDRITEVNGELRAVIALRTEEALAEAKAADTALACGEPTGPLHGVPVTVKDWIEVAGLPCVAGSEERLGVVSKHDATAVARLREGGAIVLGKTKPGLEDDTHPRARNPRNPSRSAGGSSGGEAAIVAAGGSPLGLGSDSGGSLRWPAHCCGVATIRPTGGRVPNTGHFPRVSPTADPRTVIGPIARTVADLELALGIISGIDFLDSGAVPVPLRSSIEVDVSRLRIASFTDFPGASPSLEVRAMVERVAGVLRSAGANVEAAVPPRLEESLPLTRSYWQRPESASWSEWVGAPPSSLTADEVERSLFEWDRFRRAMLGFMRDFDLILSPVADGPAPPFDAEVSHATWLWMLPWSLTGYPVAAIPAGTQDGLPLGIQIVARPWEEHTALATAAFLESVL